MMKKLMVLALVVVVLLVVGGVYLFTNINAIAKEAIERSLSYVLMVDVTLDKVEVSLKEGSVELYDLKVPSPDGYKTNNAFSFARLSVAIDPASLKTDTMRIKEFSTDRIQLGYEQKDLKMSNLKQLIDNASRFSSGEAKPEEEKPPSKEEEEAGKEIRIDLIRVAETGVSIAAPMLQQTVAFTLPTVEINDIGTADNNAVTVAEAVTIFLKELLVQTIEGGEGKIPAEVLAVMKLNADDITEQLKDAKEQIQDTAQKAIEDLKTGEGLDNVKEGTKKAAEDIKKGLGGLLNR